MATTDFERANSHKQFRRKLLDVMEIGRKLVARLKCNGVISGRRTRIKFFFNTGNPDMAWSENRNGGRRRWLSTSGANIKVDMLSR